ncbi:MAG: diaminopimelate epimerase [Candidatus Methanospirare jalkutatii]|nr:diaminopimelate epimerase [Candidatus Methanospirare jalkutatii]MCW7079907.1 diaminopimelate epimerase [Candidatus Methanospirare jalkutatii]
MPAFKGKEMRMRLRFTKMHGCGNDFILVNESVGASQERKRGERAEAEREVAIPEERRGDVARALCRRRFAVGADGLIFLCEPSSSAYDFRMRIFNADGTEAEMSGNGIRCAAKFAFEHGVAPRKMRIQTEGGLRVAEVLKEKCEEAEEEAEGKNGSAGGVVGRTSLVRVFMGKPVFKCVDEPFKVKGRGMKGSKEFEEVRLSVLSVGNPHAVMLVDSFEGLDVSALGRRISSLPAFPEGVNVNFVALRSKNEAESSEGAVGAAAAEGVAEIQVRTYERGVGETLSCGTGSTASVLALHRLGILDARKPVRVLTRGGVLTVELREDGAYLTGPATEVCEGMVEISF